MPEKTIKCPSCGIEIELTEALTGQIENAIRAKYEAEANKRTAELEKQRQALDKQQKELESQRESISDQVEAALKAERKKLADDKKALEAQRREIEDQVVAQVDQKVKAARKDIAEQEKAKALAEQAEQTKALEEELEEKSKKLSEMQKQEITLRKEKRELEQKREELELENQRKLDAERKKMAEEAAKKAAEEQRLKMREKDNLIKSMQEQIATLKRKAEVGSQEQQGKALEEELQELLERSFPFDKFEGIKKGTRGADILQTVRNTSGKECGTILWESKNTKDFQKTWIPKLKKDQQAAKASISVIMSVALPERIENFGQYDGVWVTNYRSALGICTAFRETLIRVERERMITQHQDSMKDIVYKYVTGQEFAMRVKRIADAYIAMQRDLESEKRAMNRIWSKREKQIATVLDNLTGMRGEIEGIVGGQKALPAVDSLSLEDIREEDTEE